MRITRQYWATVGVGGVLAGVAILAQRPAALVGAAGIGAWLLVTQYLAAKRMMAVQSEYSVSLQTESTHIGVDQPLFISLQVERPTSAREWVDVTAPLPTAARGASRDARTVHLDSDNQSAQTSFELSFPVAGQYDLSQPTLHIQDWSGQFEETIQIERSVPITVEPNEPQNVHVGQGGELVTSIYGEHEANQTGSGLVPVEIREYQSGDPVSRIDWKTTARLNHPHVREFETETDHQTVLLVDHRAAMNRGGKGTTMLDYAREVALWYTWVVQEHSDPLGFYAVGDGGTTIEQRPASTTERYETVRAQLHDLTPTTPASQAETDPEYGGEHQPMRTQALARSLRDGQDTFTETLRPFFSTVDTYVQRVTDDPFYEGVRRQRAQLKGETWSILITDDSRREETLEAARLASAEGNHALVFLTPRVLFESDSLADLSTAYHRYLDFEEFRRRLDKLPRVSAFEVAPGDRLQSLLETQSSSRDSDRQPTTVSS